MLGSSRVGKARLLVRGQWTAEVQTCQPTIQQLPRVHPMLIRGWRPVVRLAASFSNLAQALSRANKLCGAAPCPFESKRAAHRSLTQISCFWAGPKGFERQQNELLIRTDSCLSPIRGWLHKRSHAPHCSACLTSCAIGSGVFAGLLLSICIKLISTSQGQNVR
jgi:hypothetical protein